MKITTGYHKGIGMISRYLHMVTGVALLSYITITAVIMFLLTLGEEKFNSVMSLMHSPYVLILEMFLLLSVLFHTLNGIRILFFNVGLWIEDQKDIAYTVFVFVIILFLIMFIPLFEQFTGIWHGSYFAGYFCSQSRMVPNLGWIWV